MDTEKKDQSGIEKPETEKTGAITRRKVLKGAAAVGAATVVAYAPPSLRRIAMPSALAKVSPGKEDGEKDPSSDKTGDKVGDKDPNTDKDPNEKDPNLDKHTDKDPQTDKTTDKAPQTDKTTDKDPNTDKTTDKDPNTDKTTDKNPFEKDPDEKGKEGESFRSEIPDLNSLTRTLLNEWK